MKTIPSPADLLHCKTLITGEINTGKTTLTGQLAEGICAQNAARDILVLDMAPTIPDILQTHPGSVKISGFVTFQGMEHAEIYRGGLVPPRLMGNSPAHTTRLAEDNKNIIDSWLAHIGSLQSFDLLIINDLSIYLQAGEARDLAPILCRARTVIANGYTGRALGKGKLSEHEQAGMAILRTLCDRTVRLDTVYV